MTATRITVHERTVIIFFLELFLTDAANQLKLSHYDFDSLFVLYIHISII